MEPLRKSTNEFDCPSIRFALRGKIKALLPEAWAHLPSLADKKTHRKQTFTYLKDGYWVQT